MHPRAVAQGRQLRAVGPVPTVDLHAAATLQQASRVHLAARGGAQLVAWLVTARVRARVRVRVKVRVRVRGGGRVRVRSRGRGRVTVRVRVSVRASCLG